MHHDLTPDDWARLKGLWLEYEDGSASERESLLVSEAVPNHLREVLVALITVDERGLADVDRSAADLLGMAAPRQPDDAQERASAAMIGRRLGAYRVLRLIGRGGMGAVYEAERADQSYQQRVAIKTLWRGADSAVLLQRFRSERQILASLHHPNIAPLLDGGSTEEGTPWLALEYVEGTPVDQWCDERRLGITERLDLFRQICAAVQHAHQRLVVHRDLKPSNVLVTPDGVVKLLDFGVAKLLSPTEVDGTLTSAGLSPFTAAWAAPEQLEDGPVSTVADVYSLGAILTQLLAGAPPRILAGRMSIERLRTAVAAPPRSPSALAASASPAVATARGFSSPARLADTLRGELDAIAGMALRSDPDRRYASVEALSDDVRRYLRRDRVLARPDSAAYRLWSFVRRRPAASITFVAFVLSVAGGGALAWRQAVLARAEARRAERATTFLSSLVMGSNATSYEPLIRLGREGTLAQLLDSALVRIPREFADDSRIRGRLYGAIGANLASQGRLDRALTVLDSARILTAQGYGMRSVEFARANLEWAALCLDIEGLPASRQAIADVTHIVLAHPEDQELHQRLDLVRSGQALLLGRVREADSMASHVLAVISPRDRGVLALRAALLRMSASTWVDRDPRLYLKRARAASALADSMGLAGSNEQWRAFNAEFEALLVLGRSEAAAEVLQRVRTTYADVSRDGRVGNVPLLQQQAFLASVDGDTAARRIAATSAVQAIEQGAVATQTTKLLTYATALDDALARKDTLAAVTIVRRSVRDLLPGESPLVLGLAYWHLARGENAGGHHEEALQAVRDGRRWIADTPDLESVLPLLRREEYVALKALGRTNEADSLRRSVPTRGPIAPCTPGGVWNGCPDVP
ncbi:serine/threonine-protein kinase [Gemmatimonas aurantiaca]|uniref:serine/threonine protein kinase n=1 Tax=Gemmatimonas aurantiaca TaxID=173480 RepID=UPI00301D98CA